MNLPVTLLYHLLKLPSWHLCFSERILSHFSLIYGAYPNWSVSFMGAGTLYLLLTPLVQCPWAVVLNWGQFCPPGDIWKCLKTFCLSWMGQGCWHLAGRDQGWCYTSLQCTGWLPLPLQQGINRLQMSSVEFKISSLEQYLTHREYSINNCWI